MCGCVRLSVNDLRLCLMSRPLQSALAQKEKQDAVVLASLTSKQDAARAAINEEVSSFLTEKVV